MKKMMLVLISFIFFSPTLFAADEASYQTVMSEAKQQYDLTNSLGFAWRDTHTLFKKAEEAAAAGDYKKATDLAERIIFEAKRGQEQFTSAKGGDLKI